MNAIVIATKKNQQLPDLADVFHSSSIRGVTSWEQIEDLGKGNIEELIKIARSQERNLSSNIEKFIEQKSLLEGKTGDDFKKMAEGYENPTDIHIGKVSGGWSNEPEPIDEKSINRKAGATTFNICGWCEHAGGGTCRYQYHISTSCRLLEGSSRETRFNTPCLLQNMTRQSLAAMTKRKETEVEILKIERETIRFVIQYLQSLKTKAAEKPYLMSLRPHDAFNVGDEIAVYIGCFENKNVQGDWVKAFVTFGYRHQDGCLSYQTEFPIHDNMSNYEGRGGGAGMGRPEVMDTKTLTYLHHSAGNDPAFLAIWMDNIDSKLQGFDKEKFIHGIIYGKFAIPPNDWKVPVEVIEVKSKEDADRILCCLNSDFFETEKAIKDWSRMQLRYVHPDKHNKAQNKALTAYAERQTKLVYAARDFLIQRLRNKSS